MTKSEFLRIISDGLSDFPNHELKDILYDYEEHFSSAMACGKSEEEIIDELGDPYIIVNQYRNGYLQKVEVAEPEYEEIHSETQNQSNSTTNKQNQNTDNTINTILKIAIAIFSIILLGPIAFGGIMSIFAILVAFLTVPFALSLSGIAVLLSKLGLNVLGFSAPAFIMDFPDSVIVLLTIGSVAATILMIIISVYIIKLIIILIKKGISIFSNRGAN